MLPADGHVHTEWSWDTVTGDMDATCARAIELDLPAVAFTDHMDFTEWALDPDTIPDGYDHLRAYLTTNETIRPPLMDVDGYFRSISRVRRKYPQLRIISGVELGEAHRNSTSAADLLSLGQFERVLGSVHSLPFGDKFLEPGELYREWPSEQVIREFLAEVCSLIRADTAVTVLSHIDYAVRTWPAELAPFDVWRFEDEFRQTLRLLAETEMALEVNTVVPLAPEIVDWWREEGGRFIAFGSDAHAPTTLARGLAEAARMVLAHGFVPAPTVDEFWVNAR